VNAARYYLSGGIGAGKSAAGAILSTLGAVVLNGDDAGRDVLSPGTAETAAVLQRWPQVTAARGAIDRRALGAIVFADPAQLAELEAVTAPGITARLRTMVDAHPDEIVLVEVPVLRDLAEQGWPRVVVDAPDDVRLARAIARGAMSEEVVRGVMAVQPSRAEWLAAADWVIDNSGDRDHLAGQCRRVWSELTRDSPSQPR
jgi:dephospho-CoA kinase